MELSLFNLASMRATLSALQRFLINQTETVNQERDFGGAMN